MIAVGPGINPNKNPSTEPRTIGHCDRFHSARVGNSSRNRTGSGRSTFSLSCAAARSSETPKRPIAIGTSSRPCARSRDPKVKRATPDMGSIPTVLSASPSATMTAARTSDEPVSRESTKSPSTQSEKNSGGPKRSAVDASKGARNARPRIPNDPATKDPIAATNKAAPARPRRAIS